MSKELKAFEKLDNTLCLNNISGNIEFGIDTEEYIDCNDVVEMAECLDVVMNALNELEQIKNTKPSKALDELNEIIEYITEDKKVKYKATILFDCEIIKDALLKAQKKSDKEIAFDLINEKRVDIKMVHWAYPSVKAYNVWVREHNNSFPREELTQAEFEFIGRLAGAK